MADVKISELTAQASASVDVSADVLAVVDTSATQTKKISVENLLSPITIDKSAGTITSLGTVTGNVDFNGDLDVDGTTNLDVVDIDGAVDMASTLALGGDLTISNSIPLIYMNDTSGNDNNQIIFQAGGSNIFRIGTDITTNDGTSNFEMTNGDGNASRLTITSGGNIGINTANPIRPLSVSYGAAKTSTSTAYAMSIQSNESSGQAALQFYAVGGASAAARKWQLQTTEVGVANAGEIELQPDGGKVSSKGIYFTGNFLDGNDTGISSSGDGGDLRIYTNGTNSTTFKSDGQTMLFGTEQASVNSNAFQYAVAGSSSAHVLRTGLINRTTGTSTSRGNVLTLGMLPSGTISSSNCVAAGTTIGAISFLSNANPDSYGAGSMESILTVGSTSQNRSDHVADLVFRAKPSGSTGSTERLRILGSGGIAFNGDTAAANALDDYEEGTSTATFRASSVGTITIGQSQMQDKISYTKIGQIVFFKGRLTVTAVDNAQGEFEILNLPFTSANPAGDGAQVCTVYFENSNGDLGNDLVGLIPDNSTTITIRESGTGGTGTNLAGNAQNGTVLIVSGHYFTVAT